ncbi:MAG: deoxycytidylate deaminase [Candidatus Hodarchaeales archaeon]
MRCKTCDKNMELEEPHIFVCHHCWSLYNTITDKWEGMIRKGVKIEKMLREGKENRITFEELFMNTALLASMRHTCRTGNGCVLVHDNHIVSMGYNGSPSGHLHCQDVGCLMIDGHCLRTVHAEQNAVAHLLSRYDRLIAYITSQPCVMCMKLMYQVNVREVVYIRDYPDEARDQLFQDKVTFREFEGRTLIKEKDEKFEPKDEKFEPLLGSVWYNYEDEVYYVGDGKKWVKKDGKVKVADLWGVPCEDLSDDGEDDSDTEDIKKSGKCHYCGDSSDDVEHDELGRPWCYFCRIRKLGAKK